MKDIKNNEIEDKSYRFSHYVLSAGQRELRRGAEEIELQPRVFDLLLYLLRNRDRAIDKDELQDAVWPGMVVTETALTRAVMKARKAVGDNASAQAVIKTLHGHGYRFVAELLPEEAPEPALPPDRTAPSAGPAAVDDEKSLDPPTKPGKFHSRSPWVFLAALVIVIALFLGWGQFRSISLPAGEIRVAVLPLENQSEDPELAWTSLGIMSLASKLLDSDEGLTVVPDGHVISLANSFGWSGNLADPANEDLLDRLRRVYGATHVLAMSMTPDGLFLRMNYALLDNQDALQQGTMVGEKPTELAKGVVQGVYGLLLGRSRLGEEIPLVSADPFNNEAFARGLGLSLEGRCSEAVRYFRLIAEQEPTLFSPRYELASCLRILGEMDEAESLLVQLVNEQQDLGATRYLAQAKLVLGIVYNRSGQLDKAEENYRSALEVSRAIDDPELSARILQNLSILAEDRNDWDEAWRLLDLALLDYQAAGREVLPGHFHSARANLKMDQGELLEAEDYLAQALQSFREVGDLRNEAMMLNNTGYLRRLQGRLEEAEDFHLRSLAIREEIGDRVGVGRNYMMLVAVLTARGEFQQALEAAGRALEIARETNDRLFEGASLANLGDVQKALGDAVAARQSYIEGREIFENIQDRMRVLQSNLKLAELDLDEGLYDETEATAYQVLNDARSLDLFQPEVQALELIGDVYRARLDLRAANAEYAAALERVRESSWAGKEHGLMIKQANVLLDLGELELVAPLIGALSMQEQDEAALAVQARYAKATAMQ